MIAVAFNQDAQARLPGLVKKLNLSFPVGSASQLSVFQYLANVVCQAVLGPIPCLHRWERGHSGPVHGGRRVLQRHGGQHAIQYRGSPEERHTIRDGDSPSCEVAPEEVMKAQSRVDGSARLGCTT